MIKYKRYVSIVLVGKKMAKTISCWISKKQEKELQAFCKKHNVKPYAVFKIGLLRMLKTKDENLNIPQECAQAREQYIPKTA